MENVIIETLKVLSIVLLTMFKFIFGPTLGYSAGYSYLTSVSITVTGMMSGVVLFSYLGLHIRTKFIDKIVKQRRTFTKRNRQFVTLWKKYGIKGIAFLTPIILTPVGGTLLLAAYKTGRQKIIIYMLISAVFWALVITGLVYAFGQAFLDITGYE